MDQQAFDKHVCSLAKRLVIECNARLQTSSDFDGWSKEAIDRVSRDCFLMSAQQIIYENARLRCRLEEIDSATSGGQ